MKALIVARTCDNLEKVLGWLEEAGISIVHDRSWRKAMERIQADPSIDIVLISTGTGDDVDMKILKSVRLDQRLCFLPIVMMGSEFDAYQIRQYLVYNVTEVVILPIDRDALLSKVSRAAEKSRRSVLLVDDEPAILDILEQHLSFERYRPVLANTFDEAVAKLEKESIQVVVSDIRLGGKTGIDLLQFVQANYPGIPVILITGYSGKFTAKDAMALGADGFFTKPFKNTELAATLRECITRYDSKLAPKISSC
jgi:DNA-binding NtrC family response regulator